MLQTLPARVPSQIRYTDGSAEQRSYVLRHLECSASDGTYFNHAILSTQDVRVAVKASACFGIDDTYLQWVILNEGNKTAGFAKAATP